MARVEVKLTTTWQEVVVQDLNYLIQLKKGNSKGEKFLAANASSIPTDSLGFELAANDTLSSIVYPSIDGIWARAKDHDVTILVDSWV